MGKSKYTLAEQMAMRKVERREEQLKKSKPKPRKPFRKPPKRYLSYEIARAVAISFQCRSANEYWDWHDAHRPNNIPKNPYKVYKEWVSWQEFLNTNNHFPAKGETLDKVYRPYWEAVRWAQRLGYEHNLSKEVDWKFYTEENEIPDDIPINPRYTYRDEWKGWKAWFGVGVREKIMSEQENIAILALCTAKNKPNNMIELVIAKDGLFQMKDKLEARPDLSAFRAYKWENELSDQFNLILTHFGSDQGGEWLIRDMNAFLFELDNFLIKYVAPTDKLK